jgi:hypothetical protein
MSRLAHLSTLAAKSTLANIESHRFFPGLADSLVTELESFLGAPGCVALCCATGEFSFEHGDYGYDGLRVERGAYRIPLMFKLPSVTPGVDLLLRLRLYLTRIDHEHFECQIEESAPFNFSLQSVEGLASRVYEYLCFACSSTSWFELHPHHHCFEKAAPQPQRAQGAA